jgi:hypothetical protein
MKTNSDRRNTNKRGHANEHMKTSLRNGGRIAGMGILEDDYSESAYPSVVTRTDYLPERKVDIPLTEEEKKFRDEGGPVITYRIAEDKP